MLSTLARITLTVLLVSVVVLPSHGNFYGKRGDKDDLYSAILQAAESPSRRDLTADFDTESAIESVLRMARQQESKFTETKRG